MSRKTYRNVIVNDETIKNINPKNIALVDKFLREKSIRTSPITISNYRSDANIFFTWVEKYNDNKFFIDIKKLEFADFFVFASNELQWKSARQNRVRSFLSSLSIFIEKYMDEEYPNFRNVILKTIESSPKEFAREKTILSNEQVEDLLNHFSETDSQKACWIALAAYSGARFSELFFTTDLIDENNTAFGDLFLSTTRKIKTKGRGKDGKLLYKYILREKFLPYYKRWLQDREIIMNKYNQKHTSLFIRDDGTPAKDGTIRSWITTIESYLGVPFYPHCLRHYLVSEFSRKNIPANLIKELVGWSNISLVDIYDDNVAADKSWKELDNLK